MAKTNKGLVFALIVIIGLSFLIFAFVEQTSANSIGNFSPFCPATYLISISNGNTIARNCLTGKIDFSSSDSFTTIQSTINNMRGKCGNILFMPQTFSLAKNLLDYVCINLVGLASGGDFNNAPNNTVLTSTNGTNPIVTIEQDASHPTINGLVQMQFITLTTNAVGNNQDGVLVSPINGIITDNQFLNVKVFSAGGNCFNIKSGGQTWFTNVYAEDCKQSGIKQGLGVGIQVVLSYVFGNINDGINDTSGNFLTVTNSIVSDNGASGIACVSASGQCQLTSMDMVNNGNSTYPAININGQTSALDPTLIADNKIIDSRASGSAATSLITITFQTFGSVHDNGLSSPNTKINVVFSFQIGLSNLTIAHNVGFNPVNKLSTPFRDSQHTLGLIGNSANPTANTTYHVFAIDLIALKCSGGTGVNLNVTDTLGNIIFNYKSVTAFNITALPIGYALVFGKETSSPTCIEYGN